MLVVTILCIDASMPKKTEFDIERKLYVPPSTQLYNNTSENVVHDMLTAWINQTALRRYCPVRDLHSRPFGAAFHFGVTLITKWSAANITSSGAGIGCNPSGSKPSRRRMPATNELHTRPNGTRGATAEEPAQPDERQRPHPIADVVLQLGVRCGRNVFGRYSSERAGNIERLADLRHGHKVIPTAIKLYQVQPAGLPQRHTDVGVEPSAGDPHHRTSHRTRVALCGS